MYFFLLLLQQEYDRAFAVYKNSPAYAAYIQAKSRGSAVIEDPDPKGVKSAERRIDIQPAEDEEDPDDGLSVKHVAHSRYGLTKFPASFCSISYRDI